MENLIRLITEHGYSLIFAIALLESLGIPVPASVAMLIAGAASAWGKLSFPASVLAATVPILLGDSLLYWAGRSSGWALLSVLCRVSLNPETCILRSAESFYKRGKLTLVFAKFVPGVATMAPPLAGSMKMKYSQFVGYDLAGILLYTAGYAGLGYVGSEFLRTILKGISTFGTIIEWLIALSVIGFLCYRVYLYWTHRMYRVVPRVQVDELAQRLREAASEIVIADVRSHGYYDKEAVRIQGSMRIEPNNLEQFLDRMPKGADIYLYCT